MKSLIAVAALIAPLYAHAVDLEFGYGLQWSKNMGDGTWYQQGGPHTLNINGKAWLLGLSGDLYQAGAWSARWHASYVYYGGLNAGCTCTARDEDYDPVHHVRLRQPPEAPMGVFNGQGHVQGVPVTLDIGYTLNGVRFAIEGGIWAYWQTWHESAQVLGQNINASHKTTVQFAPVVGARIENATTSLSYRYYRMRPLWNPYPGVANGTHMLMLTYKF